MSTYKAIVAVRYPELVVQEGSHTNIGHFVPHEATVMQGGFRTVLWNVPKDLRLAVEDIVVFCKNLRNCCPCLCHVSIVDPMQPDSGLQPSPPAWLPD